MSSTQSQEHLDMTCIDDLAVFHDPVDRDRVRELIAEFTALPDQQRIDVLEAAGFRVVVDGCFRMTDDGEVVTDAEFILGPEAEA